MTRHWSRTDIQALIAEARTWIGVPFRHQGRTRRGVDCIGFLGAVANTCGAVVTLPTDYGMDVDPARFIRGIREWLEEIPISRACEGDFLVIRFKCLGTHLVLRTDVGIIHASTSAGKVVEHNLDRTWERCALTAFRLPGRYTNE